MILFSNDSSTIYRYDSDASEFSDIDPTLNHKLLSFLKSFEHTNTSIDKNVVITPGVLYADDNFIVYEKPPSVNTIFHINKQVDNIDSDSEPDIYSLPCPWQVYFVSYSTVNDVPYISNIWMYFSPTSIKSFDQPVYLPPLANFYSNGLLCRPMLDNMDDVTPSTNDVNGLVELSYNWVWNSGSNADLTETILQLDIHSCGRRSSIIKDYTFNIYSPTTSYYSIDVNRMFQAWEKLSLEEALFVEWVSPCISERYFTYYRDVISSSDTSSYVNDNSECCENCQYYDEDGEPVSGYCVEDHSCSCHDENTLSASDIYDILRSNDVFTKKVSIKDLILADVFYQGNVRRMSSSHIDFSQYLESSLI